MNEGLFREGNRNWHWSDAREVLTAPGILSSNPSNHRDAGSCRRLKAHPKHEQENHFCFLKSETHVWGLHRCNCVQIKDKKEHQLTFYKTVTRELFCQSHDRSWGQLEFSSHEVSSASSDAPVRQCFNERVPSLRCIKKRKKENASGFSD